MLFCVCLLLGARASAQTQDEFFDGNVLHDVYLTVNTRDWQSLKDNADQNTYYPADLQWRGLTVRSVGIRSRGRSTRNGLKPGLRVDMNRYTSKQDFLGLKSFDLKNMFDDRSLIHESVSMKLIGRLGMPAPREAHTRLFINNEYAGVYVIVEEVDRTFISRIFGPDEGSSDNGGYLFEYKPTRQWQFDYLGSALQPYAELFDPKTHETDPPATLYGPIEDLNRIVNEIPDGQFVTQTSPLLDLAETMRYLAVEDFMAEFDGFVGNWTMNNFYLYRFRSGISWLLPWDKSMTFSSVTHPVDYNLGTNMLSVRAMAVPELRRLYFDTLLQCAAAAAESDGGDPPRTWLEAEVDHQGRRIEDAVGTDPVYPFSQFEFHTELEMMRNFGRLRSAYVTCEVQNRTDPEHPADCNLIINPPPPEDGAAAAP